MAVLIASLGLGLVTERAARAAVPKAPDCCKTDFSSDGKTMYITGYVSYRGELLYMSVGGQRCLSRAGAQRAYIKATIPTKYMPNGKHLIDVITKVDGEVRYAQQYFTITDSPAVYVEITSPKTNIVKTSSPSIDLIKKGAIRRSVCTLDGSAIACGGSSVSAGPLEEGEHVFKVRVEGRDGFSWSDTKRFVVDTQAPRTPEISGGGEAWDPSYARLEASSADAGSGIARWQYRVSRDGGATYGGTRSGKVFELWQEGERHVQFRAIDRAGHASEWATGIARVDGSMPSEPQITAGGDPCSFPVTLTAAAQDAGSGIDRYEWTVTRYGSDGSVVTTEHTGDQVVLDEPGYYMADVVAYDRAGNSSVTRSWSNDCAAA